MELKELLSKKLSEVFPDLNFDYSEFRNDLSITFPKENVVEVADFLKTDDDLKLIMLEDVTAIDWAKRQDRFTVIYIVYSLHLNKRIILRVNVDEKNCNVDTVSSVWASAEWYEREAYDMYGIEFNNHPDLRRMYMPEEFEYHPLRKDFPLMGIPGSLSLPKK